MVIFPELEHMRNFVKIFNWQSVNTLNLILINCIYSKLGLFLPHPVDSKNAKAQWDGNQEKLFVTMRMTRPYDFINF